MGSYYDLRVGGYSVLSNKWPIDEAILSLFVEADKVNSSTPPDLPSVCANVHEDDEFIGYCSTATAIADRLDLMGFTPEIAKEEFSLLLKDENRDVLRLAEKVSSREAEDELYARLSADAEEEVRFLSELSFEKWVEAVGRLKREGIRWKSVDSEKPTYARELDPLETHILDAGFNNERPHLGFYCSDLRFLIRAFIACAEPTDVVVLDCTDMVHAGYFADADPITTQARMSITADARTVEKILVLTEGRSDTKILQATLEALYPHLCEFLSFLDHDSFSVSGGAGNLLNLLRGFAGASVSNRVLALFDNDTAGSVQFAKARAMALPKNFRVLQLPYLFFAERYPTLGPTGLLEMNINASACSIELYLGRAALTEQSRKLTPVQWTGYERSLSRYQGELLDKYAVQKRYLDALRQGRADRASVDLVFRQILRAFHT